MVLVFQSIGLIRTKQLPSHLTSFQHEFFEGRFEVAVFHDEILAFISGKKGGLAHPLPPHLRSVAQSVHNRACSDRTRGPVALD